MRESTFTVFDEYVPKGNSGFATAVFTGAQFNVQLARHNSLGLHMVFDNITTDAAAHNLYGFIDVSCDGRNWVQRSNPNAATPYNTVDADLVIPIPASSTAVLQSIWSDACYGVSRLGGSAFSGGPLLGLVRVRIFFDSTAVGGHVRLHATQRDH